MRLLSTTMLLFAAVALTACGSPSVAESDPVDGSTPNQGIVAGTVTVRAERNSLTLRNTTEFVVGYMIVDYEMATIALFPPCGTTCPRLKQGETVVVPYSAIGGYTANTKRANVLWFKYQRRADGTLVPIEGMNVVEVAL